MMQCKNHPTVPAIDRCAGCAEQFCANCLVEIQGQKYCSACKIMAFKGVPVIPDEGTIPCKEAGEALTYGIISLFCFGFVTGPVAISKALNAKRQIAADPRLGGSGKATAGLVIGIIGTVVSVLFIILKISGKASR